MNTRIFTLLIAFLAMMPSVGWGQDSAPWNGSANTDWYNENQAEFTITTAEQLAGLAELVNENTNFDNKTIYLGANIVLNKNSENYENWGTTPPANEWTPIGNKDVFTGTFDGCGHTISGLYLNSSENLYCGLFGYLTTGCITNINVTNSYIAAKNVGGICGNIKSEGKISKCSFNGIIVVNSSTNIYCGGICGSSTHGESTIESCYFEGELRVNINNNSDLAAVYVGGITGVSGAAIESCYNKGNITVSGSDNSDYLFTNVGGIAGSVTSEVKYCYNTGKVLNTISEGTNSTGDIVGSIDDSIGNGTLLGNYNLSTEESTVEGVINASKEQFNSGYVAYELRKAGGNYGQDIHSGTPAETPTLLCFTPDDAVYKLTLDYSEYDGNGQTEKLVNSKYLDLPLLENSEEGKDAGWYDENGNLYTSESAIDGDITLYAQIKLLRTITIEDTENGTITADKEKAIMGEIITLTAAPAEGYQLASITVTTENGTTITVSPTGEKIYTFIMPAKDVTLTANFQKAEIPTDPDEGDEGDDIHHPQRPIKYYNIYVDTICPGLDVETSKDVVQEGHQVSAYLTIQAECDTTGMRFEYKRGLFGYWQDLKELEGVQPGEYIIKNIYTDIYIRALDATLPEEESTGLDDLEGIQAYAKEGSIYVYTPNREEVMIISMSGAILKHEEQIGWQSYSMNRGIYIVRVGEKVFKLKN